ncbi:MAG TPA: ATP-binding protein [Candidatus Saccharimonadales bacterium]
MKQLQLPAPTVLIMMGLPGAGKSAFARHFAETYGLPLISLDKIRYELFNEPAYTPHEQDIVNRVADYMTGELLRSQHSFVIDGVHTNVKTNRMALHRQARDHGFQTLVVWAQVDEPTAKVRSLKRNSKKRDDIYNRSLPEAAFEALKKQLTPPTGENYVVISGKHTFPGQHKAVIRKLLPPAAQPITSQAEPVRKVITPTPAVRRMSAPTRPQNRRIQIS